MPLPPVIKDLFYTESPPSLGPEKRLDAMDFDSCQTQIQSAFESEPIRQANLVQSALLLWHDHLEPSHSVSQKITCSDGSFVHGLMHRREPDYSNAKYWFNRVGSHPTFPEISNRTKELLAGSSLAYLTEGGWDSFAMVDAVAATRAGSKEYLLLQAIQKVEFEVLMERFCD